MVDRDWTMYRENENREMCDNCKHVSIYNARTHGCVYIEVVR